MSPKSFEMPLVLQLYTSFIYYALTFGFAFIVMNCVLSILIELYCTFRHRHQLAAAAEAANEKDWVLVRVTITSAEHS